MDKVNATQFNSILLDLYNAIKTRISSVQQPSYVNKGNRVTIQDANLTLIDYQSKINYSTPPIDSSELPHSGSLLYKKFLEGISQIKDDFKYNHACSSNCIGSCQSSCQNNCGANCGGSCSGCSGSCTGCLGGCGNFYCSYYCGGQCSNQVCAGGCQNSCSPCVNGCSGGCQSSCKGNCSNKCSASCGTGCSEMARLGVLA